MLHVLASILPLAVRSTSAQEVFQLQILEGERFTQTSESSIAPGGPKPFLFKGRLVPLLLSQVANNPTLTPPSGSSATLRLDEDSAAFSYTNFLADAASLGSSYPAGSYTFSYTSKSSGATSLPFILPTQSLPGAPRVANFAAAQKVDANSDFTLSWTPPAGASQSDEVEVTIIDETGSIISKSESAGSFQPTPGTTTSYDLAAGTFEPGKSYTGRITFYRVASYDFSTLPAKFAAYFSETEFTIKTVSEEPPGPTPPVLKETSPPSGVAFTNVFDFPIAFAFDQEMKPVHSIQWSTNVNPLKVIYQWFNSSSGSNSVLGCSYPGGWPAGTLSWVLNPDISDPNAFRAATDVLLPERLYSGSIQLVVPALVPVCDGADPLAAAAFGIMKTAFYRQDESGRTVLDREDRGEIRAWMYTASFFDTNRVAFTNPSRIPNLVVFTNEMPPIIRSFNQSAATLGELDALFQPGDYLFQRGSSSVHLQVGGPLYPRIPHFINLPTKSKPTDGLTVQWEPLAAPGPNQLVILEIVDTDGNVVLRAPDACANRILPATASSFTIPAGMFSNSTNYVVALSFVTLTDGGKRLPGVDGTGIAAVRSTTRASLEGSSQGGALPAVHFTQEGMTNGQIRVAIEAVAGVSYVLEAAADLLDPILWVPLETNLATSATLSFTNLDEEDFMGRFFRARPLVSTVPLTSTNAGSALNADRSVSQEFGPNGGTLTLVTSDGALCSLEVSPGALFSPEEISLSEVITLADAPFTNRVLTLEISPDLTLYTPADLNIQLPSEPGGTLAGFGRNVRTGEFFLVPTLTSNSVHSLSLSHLGVVGLARLSASELQRFSTNIPTEFLDDLAETTALLLLETNTVLSSQSIRASTTSRSSRLARQFQQTVYPALVSALSNPNALINSALGQYHNWYLAVARVKQTDRFAPEIQLGNSAAIAVIHEELDYLEPKARAHDQTAILVTGVMAQVLSFVPWRFDYAPGEESALLERIRKVRRFRLEMDSEVDTHTTQGPVLEKTHLDFYFYGGDSEDNSTNAWGSGPLTFTKREHFTPAAPCILEVNQEISADFEVLALRLYGQRNGGTNLFASTYRIRDVTLQAFLPILIDDGFTLICDGIRAHPYYWGAGFALLHKEDSNLYSPIKGWPPELAYKFGRGWAVKPNGSELIATRKYTRSRKLKDETLVEETELKLHHDPE